MSTKIYNGYRYTEPDGQAANPFTLVTALDAALRPVVMDAYLTTVADTAAAIYDGIDTRGDGNGNTTLAPLLAAEYRVVQAAREIAATQQRNPELDFSCVVCILADPENPAHLYLMTYCEQDIRAAMLTIPGVTEYGYWNNTDGPDELTQDEWDTRGDTWDRILGSEPPARRGLTWNLGDITFEGSLTHRDALVAKFPDRTTRARRIATHRAKSSVTATPEELQEHGFHYLIERLEAAHDAALRDTGTLDEIEASLDELTFDALLERSTETTP